MKRKLDSPVNPHARSEGARGTGEGHTLGEQLHISPAISDLAPRVAPVLNAEFVKPQPGTGLWTSTYANGKSEWVEAYEDMFGEDGISAYALNWFVLTPCPTARILVIDSLVDLRRLLRQYPARRPYLRMLALPDFEAISRDYDAMSLTSRGQWATRLTQPSLYGWDSESTLWFRWMFTEVRRIIPLPPVAEAALQSRVDPGQDASGAQGYPKEGRS